MRIVETMAVMDDYDDSPVFILLHDELEMYLSDIYCYWKAFDSKMFHSVQFLCNVNYLRLLFSAKHNSSIILFVIRV